MPEPVATPDPARGVVLAASGQRYATLAVQTAASIRAACPGLPVDLYTDAPTGAPVFAAEHVLERSWFRPKFEAMIRSRFERTLYMDVDILVVADIGDVFDILDQFDIAAAHVQNRNQAFARRIWRRPMPNAFPQINGGLIAYRRSPAVTAFLEACQRAMIEDGLKADQPVFREMLYDSDLRLAILPPEYNARSTLMWRVGSSALTAPRVLHNTAYQTRMKDDRTPVAHWRVHGPLFMRRVRALIAADRTLNPDSTTSVPAAGDVLGRLRGLFRGTTRK